MPTRDYVVKLVGDSKSYQAAQDQATRALERFQRQNLSSGAVISTITSTMSRYIGVMALAKGAVDAFTATVRGSQTTSDQFDATIRAAKTSVNTFFSSLSTGDFTPFNQGLENLILKSKQAYNALDRLGNASISWNYFFSEGMADITELQVITKDKSKPLEERQAAAKRMEEIQTKLKEYAAGYTQRAREAVARVMTEATNLDWSTITRTDLDKVMEIDVLSVEGSQEKKAQLKSRYQEYLQEVKKYEDWFNKEVRTYERRQVVGPMGGMAWQEVDVTSQEDLDLRTQDLRDIAREFQDAILYNQLLERESNETLQNLTQLISQADSAERSMRSINRAVLESKNTLFANDGAGGSAAAAATQPKYMTDLEYDRMITQERLKIVTKYSEDWVDLQQQLITTESQMQEQRLRETIQNEDDLAAALVLLEQVKQRQLYDVAVEGYVKRLAAQGEFVEQSQSIAESTDDITGNMKSLRDSLDGIDDGGRAVENLGRAMSQLSDNKGWQGFGHIIAGVGSAVQAYTQLAAAAQLAATSQAAAETPTVWGKIAAVTSMLTVFTSMISQVQSMNSYAEGGIIGGNNFTDGIVARVSSGEMMINPADQKKLYDSIHSGDMGGGGGPAVITGEMIVMAVNAYGRRTNRGELLFAGR